MNNLFPRPMNRDKDADAVLLYENPQGFKILRFDYQARTKIKIANKDGVIMTTYRCNKVDAPLPSPFLSWENMEDCGLWHQNEQHILDAVRSGKRLFAGVSYNWGGSETLLLEADLRAELEASWVILPPGVIGGYAVGSYGNRIKTYLCREGCLANYFNINEVMEYCGKLGYVMDLWERTEMRKYAAFDIRSFASYIPAPEME